MDETAVSSDPIVALLLDEVIVKDWCKRMFKNVIAELWGIYNLTAEEIEERSSALLKFTVRLSSILTVLEELESSFKGSLSAQLHDIHHLQESILKTKQHTEMIIWYTRHRSLEDLNRHKSLSSWRSDVLGRKSAARDRAWPDPTIPSIQDGPTLFIDDALSNIDVNQEYTAEMSGLLDIASLQKDGGSLINRVRIEGMAGCYPFENLRSAIDILFLCGSSDLVLAKQAILLYYLFDRLWKLPDERWRHCIDDFAATFSITRHSILESLTFYLLDNQSDEALQEACRLLPEISGPTTHPKVAQVLLERQNPYAALMVFRWSGRDGAVELVSLREAVTAVRVRVECGLLVEAFMYQRSLCTKVKDMKLRHELYDDTSNELKDDCEDWTNWLEVLITEICLLCIRRDLVDRIIALPWNADEEKHLHKCLLDHASDGPLTNAGSLLVVFYLQRHRYMEAYQVDRKLQSIEQDFISENSVGEEVEIRMRSTGRWRAGLVDKSLQLLPEVEQQRVKSGNMTELVSPGSDMNAPTQPDLPQVQDPTHTSLLLSFNSSVLRTRNENPSSIPSIQEFPSNFSGFTNHGSPTVPQVNAFNDSGRGMTMLKSISKHFKFDDITTSATRQARPLATTPLKEFNRSSSRLQQSKHLQTDQLSSISTDKERVSFKAWFPISSPYSHRVAANPVDSPSSINGLFKGFQQDGLLKASGKSMSSSRLGRDITADASGDFMEMSWSNKEERVPVQNDGPRWRSDDASDDEDELQIPDTFTAIPSHNMPSRGTRKTRFIRR